MSKSKSDTTNEREDDEAWSNGVEARRAFAVVDANPHPLSSHLWHAWRDGWMAEDHAVNNSAFAKSLRFAAHMDSLGYHGSVGYQAGTYRFVVYRGEPTPSLTHWNDTPIVYEQSNMERPRSLSIEP